MCNDCWKQFKGWCKSFTATETYLSILEGLLLILCISFVIFLILHIVACSNNFQYEDVAESSSDSKTTTTGKSTVAKPWIQSTFSPGAQCSWKPSHKTKAVTHYYESSTERMTASKSKHHDSEDILDGVEADPVYAEAVLALVKQRPPRDVTFGCAATIISEWWALTAASCLEAIEEVDSLESYVLQSRPGAPRGRAHAVVDVALHPAAARDAPARTDLAALRAQDRLTGALQLPSLLDFFKLTIGEEMLLLGFGPYRSVPPSSQQALRQTAVRVLPGALCPADAWSPRHLSRGAPEPHGRCGLRALCAAPRARHRPCGYCAGAPLVRGGTLLAVMADNPQCAVSCDPVVYVNIAAAADWVQYLLDQD